MPPSLPSLSCTEARRAGSARRAPARAARSAARSSRALAPHLSQPLNLRLADRGHAPFATVAAVSAAARSESTPKALNGGDLNRRKLRTPASSFPGT